MDKLFDYKRTYTGYDGDEYIDMSIPVVNINSLSGNTTGKINQDEQGRIDNFTWNNVSKKLDMIDLVMYSNHIFNPFSVKEDDLLYIPIDNDDVYVSSGEPSLIDGTKYSKNSNGEKSKTYAENIEYLANQGLGVK